MALTKKISPRIAGICGVVGPIIAFTFIAVSISINNHWWSWAGNTLSDLGHIDQAYSIIFDLGLVIAGVLEFGFVLGLPHLLEKDNKLVLSGIGLLGVGTICLVLIGVFPDGTSLHDPFSISFFTITALSILTIGVGLFRTLKERIWGLLLLSVVFLTFVAFVLNTMIPDTFWGFAINETIASVAFSEFSIIFGTRLLFLR